MTVLRGASVDVNSQKVLRFVFVLVALALAVLSASFFVSGLHRNANISDLQRHGVRVSVTITTCTGELGGSGSNLADFRCEGTFTLHGQRFHDTVPGSGFRATGSTVFFITARNSPSLLATMRTVRDERSSWSVFILPFILLALLIASVTIVARRRRVSVRRSQ